MVSTKPLKHWFTTLEAPGQRTLKEQLTGLDVLRHHVPDKTVLDVGCAEGLISMQLFDEGAVAVHGIELVPEYVSLANKMRGDRACTFEVADATFYKPVRQYDIVIMLAILQKLVNPTAVCLRMAAAARKMVVIRLPPDGAPMIVDARSSYVPHLIGDAMTDNGWRLMHLDRGHLDEWVGYYERQR